MFLKMCTLNEQIGTISKLLNANTHYKKEDIYGIDMFLFKHVFVCCGCGNTTFNHLISLYNI